MALPASISAPPGKGDRETASVQLGADVAAATL